MTDTGAQLARAKAAAGDWPTKYACHIKSVKVPLQFAEYKRLWGEWEKVMFSDPGDPYAKRKLEELEAKLGL